MIIHNRGVGSYTSTLYDFTLSELCLLELVLGTQVDQIHPFPQVIPIVVS